MSAQVLFNPLTYIDRLTRGGFTPDQARASAEALETAFSESVATKTDVAELKRDIGETEARLRLEISHAKYDILRWVFGFNLALVGAIFAIMKFVK
ncbi:MAG: hypothetical protein WBO09_01855 [Methylocystis silviterrae]|uniref:hypothetical protein n=1 Tax=Methylocystis TaxID=133 RepID=UPI0025FF8192|nr:hypothetical protein [Methylocystis sp.]